MFLLRTRQDKNILIVRSTANVSRLFPGQHIACFALDALRGTPLRTDGDPSGFHRARRDQQPPHRHREARKAQAAGGGLDINILPDNMTRIVVSVHCDRTCRTFGFTTRTVQTLCSTFTRDKALRMCLADGTLVLQYLAVAGC